MYRAITIVLPGTLYTVPVVVGGSQWEFDTIEKAKAATQATIAASKAVYANGYDAYILDLTTHQVVSFATIPQPSLSWVDSAPRS